MRSFNLRRHTLFCKMNGHCYGFNSNIGSQEPYEDSHMSSAEGSAVRFLENQSDLSSEVVSSDDEREGEFENKSPWSSILDEAIAQVSIFPWHLAQYK